MPLTWRQPDYAYDLAQDWEAQFKRKRPRLAHLLTVQMPTTVTNVTPAAGPGGLVGVDWTESGGSGHTEFGMVVLAIGFGEEKCYLDPAHPYRGFEFWANDPFASLNLGCPEPPDVMISGSGDGGLQDFLRITTHCRSAWEIWDSLATSADQILTDVRDAEDQFQRAFVLGPGVRSSCDCPVLKRLHACYEALAAAVHLRPRVRVALNQIVRSDFGTVKLLHGCSHFGQSYGLNHFLVLLLVRHLEMVLPRLKPILLPNLTLADVQCQGHAAGDASVCNGQPHEIFTQPQPTCVRPPPAPGNSLGHFQVVILRHGIDPTPLRAGKGKGAPMPPLRQLLPYHWPT